MLSPAVSGLYADVPAWRESVLLCHHTVSSQGGLCICSFGGRWSRSTLGWNSCKPTAPAHLNPILHPKCYRHHQAEIFISYTAPIFPSGSKFLRQKGVLFLSPLKRTWCSCLKQVRQLHMYRKGSPTYSQNEKARCNRVEHTTRCQIHTYTSTCRTCTRYF